MEENRKEDASARGCVCILCVSRLTFVLTFDVKRSFRVCVCAKGIHLLLMAKRDQIAVPVSSRMAAVRVVNVCFFKGTPCRILCSLSLSSVRAGKTGRCVYLSRTKRNPD